MTEANDFLDPAKLQATLGKAMLRYKMAPTEKGLNQIMRLKARLGYQPWNRQAERRKAKEVARR